MPDNTGITERRNAAGVMRYRAEAWDNDARRRVFRTFPTAQAARNWRREMQVNIKNGSYRAAEPVIVRELWEQWIVAARSGVVRTRGGSEYKPGVLRSYELAFTGRLLRSFGQRKVGEVRRAHVQAYVDRLVAEGLAAQTVRNSVTALRVLFKYAIRRELISANPCDGVELPAGGTARDRIEDPSGALALVQALTRPDDRALMATAFFAGLRRGELMALRWKDVDLQAHTITVDAERGSYDPKTKTFGPPKSKKGARTLGIPELLVPLLEQVRPLDVDRAPDVLVFRRGDGLTPFSDTALRDRCLVDWGWTYDREQKKHVRTRGGSLQPIGLHEARHSYASLMIAAGVNIKTISEWMGHSSVTITLDRYGHLLPGSAKVALGLLNSYLEEALS